MQGDSSSTSRPGGTAASTSTGAGTAGTAGTAGSTSATARADAAGGRAGRATYGGSYGGSDYGAYGDTGYGSGYDSADSRLAQRRARALEAANSEERGRTLAFGAGIAVGALLGAGLALLLAPQSGAETRAVLTRGARRIPERARDGWDDLGDELRSALRRRTKGVRRGMRSARWKAADMMEG